MNTPTDAAEAVGSIADCLHPGDLEIWENLRFNHRLTSALTQREQLALDRIVDCVRMVRAVAVGDTAEGKGFDPEIVAGIRRKLGFVTEPEVETGVEPEVGSETEPEQPESGEGQLPETFYKTLEAEIKARGLYFFSLLLARAGAAAMEKVGSSTETVTPEMFQTLVLEEYEKLLPETAYQSLEAMIKAEGLDFSPAVLAQAGAAAMEIAESGAETLIPETFQALVFQEYKRLLGELHGAVNSNL